MSEGRLVEPGQRQLLDESCLPKIKDKIDELTGKKQQYLEEEAFLDRARSDFNNDNIDLKQLDRHRKLLSDRVSGISSLIKETDDNQARDELIQKRDELNDELSQVSKKYDDIISAKFDDMHQKLEALADINYDGDLDAQQVLSELQDLKKFVSAQSSDEHRALKEQCIDLERPAKIASEIRSIRELSAENQSLLSDIRTLSSADKLDAAGLTQLSESLNKFQKNNESLESLSKSLLKDIGLQRRNLKDNDYMINEHYEIADIQEKISEIELTEYITPDKLLDSIESNLESVTDIQGAKQAHAMYELLSTLEEAELTDEQEDRITKQQTAIDEKLQEFTAPLQAKFDAIQAPSLDDVKSIQALLDEAKMTASAVIDTPCGENVEEMIERLESMQEDLLQEPLEKCASLINQLENGSHSALDDFETLVNVEEQLQTFAAHDLPNDVMDKVQKMEADVDSHRQRVLTKLDASITDKPLSKDQQGLTDMQTKIQALKGRASAKTSQGLNDVEDKLKTKISEAKTISKQRSMSLSLKPPEPESKNVRDREPTPRGRSRTMISPKT